MFSKQNVPPFRADRFHILADAGIDDEPSDAEMRAFGKGIVELLDVAHSTRKLALAYVSFVDAEGPDRGCVPLR